MPVNVDLQRPLTQLVPTPQGTPQVPQLALSVRTLTQLVVHGVSPAEQLAEQTFALHIGAVAGQMLPQAPQFVASEMSALQTPLQLDVPVGHPHRPPAWQNHAAGTRDRANRCRRTNAIARLTALTGLANGAAGTAVVHVRLNVKAHCPLRGAAHF